LLLAPRQIFSLYSEKRLINVVKRRKINPLHSRRDKNGRLGSIVAATTLQSCLASVVQLSGEFKCALTSDLEQELREHVVNPEDDVQSGFFWS
jgi:hypothetical protein